MIFQRKGRHENVDVYYISQSFFSLASIRNNSDRIILLKQTSGDVESIYKDIGCYEMKHDEFKE